MTFLFENMFQKAFGWERCELFAKLSFFYFLEKVLPPFSPFFDKGHSL